jgi:hypothetical protein
MNGEIDMSAPVQIDAGPLLGAGARARAKSASQAGPSLMRHALLQPRAYATSPREPETNNVWKPADGSLEGGASLLTLRHISLQALQLRAAPLLLHAGLLRDFATELFVSCTFDYVYLGEAGFRSALEQASMELRVGAVPGVFFDMARWQLVVDCSRCFRAGTPQVTAQAIHGLVSLAESARLRPWLERQAWGHDGERRGDAVDAFRDASCRVTRYVLCEPGLALDGVALRLAHAAGARRVARTFLSGGLEDSRATFEAYVDRGRQEPPIPRRT